MCLSSLKYLSLALSVLDHKIEYPMIQWYKSPRLTQHSLPDKRMHKCHPRPCFLRKLPVTDWWHLRSEEPSRIDPKEH